jgi:hypothetical protein
MEILSNSRRKLIPSASDAYGAAWSIMWKSFVVLLVVFILYGIVSGPTSMLQWKSDGFDTHSLFQHPFLELFSEYLLPGQ